MLVKSEGKIPSTFQSSECYRWVDIRGNEVLPPPKHAAILNGDRSEMRLLGADDERKVEKISFTFKCVFVDLNLSHHHE